MGMQGGMLKKPVTSLYSRSAFEAKHPTIRCFVGRIEDVVPKLGDGSSRFFDRSNFDVAPVGFLRRKQSGNPDECGTSYLFVSGAGQRWNDPRADSWNGNVLRAWSALRSG